MPKYVIDPDQCTACAGCASVCPHMAIDVSDTHACINHVCVGCGMCVSFCPVDAVKRTDNTRKRSSHESSSDFRTV